MNKKPKIALLRWEKGQVCDALMQLETLPATAPILRPIPSTWKWYT